MRAFGPLGGGGIAGLGEEVEGNSNADAEKAWDDERHAPIEQGNQEPGCKRRKGDAHIAENSIHAQTEAQPWRALNQHGDANRVIDGREQTEQRQAYADHGDAGCHADENARCTDPDEKDHHHVRTAPAVAQPAGGERSRAEQNEAGRRHRKQRAIGHVEPFRHGDHRGGENQHAEMVDEVARV